MDDSDSSDRPPTSQSNSTTRRRWRLSSVLDPDLGEFSAANSSEPRDLRRRSSSVAVPRIPGATSYPNLYAIGSEDAIDVVDPDDAEQLIRVQQVADRQYTLAAHALHGRDANRTLAPPWGESSVNQRAEILGRVSGPPTPDALPAQAPHLPGQVPELPSPDVPRLAASGDVTSLLPLPPGPSADLFHELPPAMTPPQTALYIQRHANAMQRMFLQQSVLSASLGRPAAMPLLHLVSPPSAGSSRENSARMRRPGVDNDSFRSLPEFRRSALYAQDSNMAATVSDRGLAHSFASRISGSLALDEPTLPRQANKGHPDQASLASSSRKEARAPAAVAVHLQIQNPSAPEEIRRTLRVLPSDVLLRVIAMFLPSSAHANQRLVCRWFNSVLESACVVWYRRVPHPVFATHVTYRIKLESDAARQDEEKIAELRRLGLVEPQSYQHVVPAPQQGDEADVHTPEPTPLVIPSVAPSRSRTVSHIPTNAMISINQWISDEQVAYGDEAEWLEAALSSKAFVSSGELLKCHTFQTMMGDQLRYLFDRHYTYDAPSIDRERWLQETCLRGCCHRQWADYWRNYYQQERQLARIRESARVGGAICRALMFPSSTQAGVVMTLISATYGSLLFFAVLSWADIGSPSEQYIPLWCFFGLMMPLMYAFFGSSTVEPMVLSFLGFIGFAFSAVLVYFYRAMSPTSPMSWISCATPMLLCTSCCATYSLLMYHRFTDYVASGNYRFLAMLICTVPAGCLLFVVLLALELDGSIAVHVTGVGSSPDSSTSGNTSAAPSLSSGPVPISGLQCSGYFRLSAFAAALALGDLVWITTAPLKVFSVSALWSKLPTTAASLVFLASSFGVGVLAALSGVIQDAACYPSGVTFALAALSIISFAIGHCLSVISSSSLIRQSSIPSIAERSLLSIANNTGDSVTFSMAEVASLLAPSQDDDTENLN